MEDFQKQLYHIQIDNNRVFEPLQSRMTQKFTELDIKKNPLKHGKTKQPN